VLGALEEKSSLLLLAGYNPAVKDSPCVASSIGGGVGGTPWCADLKGKDPWKVVRRIATKSIATLNPVAFTSAVGRLEAAHSEVRGCQVVLV